ncbi:MAG: hypothetical protein WCY34_01330, partial [Candidatus Omnitrophota bacterium]
YLEQRIKGMPSDTAKDISRRILSGELSGDLAVKALAKAHYDARVKSRERADWETPEGDWAFAKDVYKGMEHLSNARDKALIGDRDGWQKALTKHQAHNLWLADGRSDDAKLREAHWEMAENMVKSAFGQEKPASLAKTALENYNTIRGKRGLDRVEADNLPDITEGITGLKNSIGDRDIARIFIEKSNFSSESLRELFEGLSKVSESERNVTFRLEDAEITLPGGDRIRTSVELTGEQVGRLASQVFGASTRGGAFDRDKLARKVAEKFGRQNPVKQDYNIADKLLSGERTAARRELRIEHLARNLAGENSTVSEENYSRARELLKALPGFTAKAVRDKNVGAIVSELDPYRAANGKLRLPNGERLNALSGFGREQLGMAAGSYVDSIRNTEAAIAAVEKGFRKARENQEELSPADIKTRQANINRLKAVKAFNEGVLRGVSDREYGALKDKAASTAEDFVNKRYKFDIEKSENKAKARAISPRQRIIDRELARTEKIGAIEYIKDNPLLGIPSRETAMNYILNKAADQGELLRHYTVRDKGLIEVRLKDGRRIGVRTSDIRIQKGLRSLDGKIFGKDGKFNKNGWQDWEECKKQFDREEEVDLTDSQGNPVKLFKGDKGVDKYFQQRNVLKNVFTLESKEAENFLLNVRNGTLELGVKENATRSEFLDKIVSGFNEVNRKENIENIFENGKPVTGEQIGKALRLIMDEAYTIIGKELGTAKLQEFGKKGSEQVRMVLSLLGEKNVGLEAGGGKTIGGAVEMIMRKAMFPEANQLWVVRAGEVDKMMKDPVVNQLLGKFGLKLVDGRNWSSNSQKIKDALMSKSSSSMIVVFDHPTLGHLRNSADRDFIQRVYSQDSIRVDEIHVPLSDRSSYIVGGGEVSVIEQLAGILDKKGAGAEAIQAELDKAGKFVRDILFKNESNTDKKGILESQSKPGLYYDKQSGEFAVNKAAKEAMKAGGINEYLAHAYIRAERSRIGVDYGVGERNGKTSIIPWEGGVEQSDRVLSDPAYLAYLGEKNGLKIKDLSTTRTLNQATLSEMLKFKPTASTLGFTGTPEGVEMLLRMNLGRSVERISDTKFNAKVVRVGSKDRVSEIMKMLEARPNKENGLLLIVEDPKLMTELERAIRERFKDKEIEVVDGSKKPDDIVNLSKAENAGKFILANTRVATGYSFEDKIKSDGARVGRDLIIADGEKFSESQLLQAINRNDRDKVDSGQRVVFYDRDNLLNINNTDRGTLKEIKDIANSGQYLLRIYQATVGKQGGARAKTKELLRNSQRLEAIKTSQALLHQAREAGYSRQLIEPLKEMLGRAANPVERQYIENIFNEVIQHKYATDLEASPYNVKGGDRIRKVSRDIAEYSQHILGRVEDAGSKVSAISRAQASWLKTEAVKVVSGTVYENGTAGKSSISDAYSIADVAGIFDSFSKTVLSSTAQVQGDITRSARVSKTVGKALETVDLARKASGSDKLSFEDKAKIYRQMDTVMLSNGTRGSPELFQTVKAYLPNTSANQVLTNIQSSITGLNSKLAKGLSSPQYAQQAIDIIETAFQGKTMTTQQQRDTADLAVALMNPAISSFGSLEAISGGLAILDPGTQKRLQADSLVGNVFMSYPTEFVSGMASRDGKVKQALAKGLSWALGRQAESEEDNLVARFINNRQNRLILSHRAIKKVSDMNISRFDRYVKKLWQKTPGFSHSPAVSAGYLLPLIPLALRSAFENMPNRSSSGEDYFIPELLALGGLLLASGASVWMKWRNSRKVLNEGGIEGQEEALRTSLIRLSGLGNADRFSINRGLAAAAKMRERYGLSADKKIRGWNVLRIRRWMSVTEDKQNIDYLKYLLNRIVMASLENNRYKEALSSMKQIEERINKLQKRVNWAAAHPTPLFGKGFFKGARAFSISNIVSMGYNSGGGLLLLGAFNSLSERKLTRLAGINGAGSVRSDFQAAKARAGFLSQLAGTDVNSLLHMDIADLDSTGVENLIGGMRSAVRLARLADTSELEELAGIDDKLEKLAERVLSGAEQTSMLDIDGSTKIQVEVKNDKTDKLGEYNPHNNEISIFIEMIKETAGNIAAFLNEEKNSEYAGQWRKLNGDEGRVTQKEVEKLLTMSVLRHETRHALDNGLQVSSKQKELRAYSDVILNGTDSETFLESLMYVNSSLNGYRSAGANGEAINEIKMAYAKDNYGKGVSEMPSMDIETIDELEALLGGEKKNEVMRILELINPSVTESELNEQINWVRKLESAYKQGFKDDGRLSLPKGLLHFSLEEVKQKSKDTLSGKLRNQKVKKLTDYNPNRSNNDEHEQAVSDSVAELLKEREEALAEAQENIEKLIGKAHKEKDSFIRDIYLPAVRSALDDETQKAGEDIEFLNQWKDKSLEDIKKELANFQRAMDVKFIEDTDAGLKLHRGEDKKANNIRVFSTEAWLDWRIEEVGRALRADISLQDKDWLEAELSIYTRARQSLREEGLESGAWNATRQLLEIEQKNIEKRLAEKAIEPVTIDAFYGSEAADEQLERATREKELKQKISDIQKSIKQSEKRITDIRQSLSDNAYRSNLAELNSLMRWFGIAIEGNDTFRDSAAARTEILREFKVLGEEEDLPQVFQTRDMAEKDFIAKVAGLGKLLRQGEAALGEFTLDEFIDSDAEEFSEVAEKIRNKKAQEDNLTGSEREESVYWIEYIEEVLDDIERQRQDSAGYPDLDLHKELKSVFGEAKNKGVEVEGRILDKFRELLSKVTDLDDKLVEEVSPDSFEALVERVLAERAASQPSERLPETGPKRDSHTTTLSDDDPFAAGAGQKGRMAQEDIDEAKQVIVESEEIPLPIYMQERANKFEAIAPVKVVRLSAKQLTSRGDKEITLANSDGSYTVYLAQDAGLTELEHGLVEALSRVGAVDVASSSVADTVHNMAESAERVSAKQSLKKAYSDYIASQRGEKGALPLDVAKKNMDKAAETAQTLGMNVDEALGIKGQAVQSPVGSSTAASAIPLGPEKSIYDTNMPFALPPLTRPITLPLPQSVPLGGPKPMTTLILGAANTFYKGVKGMLTVADAYTAPVGEPLWITTYDSSSTVSNKLSGFDYINGPGSPGVGLVRRAITFAQRWIKATEGKIKADFATIGRKIGQIRRKISSLQGKSGENAGFRSAKTASGSASGMSDNSKAPGSGNGSGNGKGSGNGGASASKKIILPKRIVKLFKILTNLAKARDSSSYYNSNSLAPPVLRHTSAKILSSIRSLPVYIGRKSSQISRKISRINIMPLAMASSVAGFYSRAASSVLSLPNEIRNTKYGIRNKVAGGSHASPQTPKGASSATLIDITPIREKLHRLIRVFVANNNIDLEPEQVRFGVQFAHTAYERLSSINRALIGGAKWNAQPQTENRQPQTEFNSLISWLERLTAQFSHQPETVGAKLRTTLSAPMAMSGSKQGRALSFLMKLKPEALGSQLKPVTQALQSITSEVLTSANNVTRHTLTGIGTLHVTRSERVRGRNIAHESQVTSHKLPALILAGIMPFLMGAAKPAAAVTMPLWAKLALVILAAVTAIWLISKAVKAQKPEVERRKSDLNWSTIRETIKGEAVGQVEEEQQPDGFEYMAWSKRVLSSTTEE